MTLIAITRMKNELDIIEAFVRHHAHSFDKLIVLDDGSTDGTLDILKALQAEGCRWF
jgi:glycosyltransferase involved in cell wall biosynthesis